MSAIDLQMLSDMPDDELFSKIFEERKQGKTWPAVSMAFGVGVEKLRKTIHVRGWNSSDFPGKHLNMDGRYSEAERPAKAKSNVSTICWDCANSVPCKRDGTGCSWSRRFIPVEGWTAEAATIQYHYTVGQQSYNVHACPQFVKG